MAKIFGYNCDSSTKSTHLSLTDMENAFKINFKSHKLIKNKKTGVGIGILHEDDCQPIVFKNKNINLIFMGKIFNTEEEQDCIFRNILISIKSNNNKLLINTLKNINGLFIMFIYNFIENKVFIINDRYGMESLYYYYDKHKIVFASEIKSILSDKSFKKEINWNFWKDFFQYGFALGDKTPFKNIFNMPNASILSFQNGSLKILKYWDYSEIKIKNNLDEETLINSGIKVLKNVFTRQSNGLKKCIVFLSGGYDSRCISCALKYYSNISFENFSTNLAPWGELDYILAKMVSDKLAVKNYFTGKTNNLYSDYFKSHFLQVEGLCTEHMWIQPLVDSIKHQEPNFFGIGADLLLRNVSATKQNINLYNDNDALSNLVNKELISYFSGYGCQNIYRYFHSKVSDKLKPDLNSIKKEMKKIPSCENKTTIFFLIRRLKNVVILAPRNLIGRKIYSYFPFFDNEFVEYSLSIPPKIKIISNIYLKILKKAFPIIMKIPTTNDNNIKKQIAKTLTDIFGVDYFSKLLNNYKRMFFMRNPKMFYGEDLQYLLTLARTINMPLFLNRNKLINQIEDDISKRNNPKLYLTLILQFCVWYNEYFPKTPN